MCKDFMAFARVLLVRDQALLVQAIELFEPLGGRRGGLRRGGQPRRYGRSVSPERVAEPFGPSNRRKNEACSFRSSFERHRAKSQKETEPARVEDDVGSI